MINRESRDINQTPRTLRRDLQLGSEYMKDHSGALLLLGGAALTIVGGNALTAETAEPKFDTNLNITTVQLDEGARIRHAPVAEAEPPIAQLDAPLTISTPDGIKVRTEFRNGTWYGVNATDIPNFDDHFDDDGIVWINQQKASVESDSTK